jgi:K(+)-stimulated pyrophosphate-energized sodium pump
MMIIASGGSYLLNAVMVRARYEHAQQMDYERPLTELVWITSAVSVVITYIVSWLLLADLGDGSLWWKLSTIITCGTVAGAVIPEVTKIFTSTNSGHVREIVEASKEGGASLNVLAGFTAGNFSAYWMGLVIASLMGLASWVASFGLGILPGAVPSCWRRRLRPGGLRIPRHGAGDHRRRFVRTRHRQRAVGIRTLADRRRAERPPGDPA